MEREKRLFHATETKDGDEIYRMIRLNNIDKDHELVETHSTGGIFTGSTTKTKISFADSSILEKAAMLLQASGKAIIHAEGTVTVEGDSWDYNYPELNERSSYPQRGMITCELTIKDGVLQPYTHKLERI